MNTDIPATVRAAIADIAAGRRPVAAVARSKAARPYISEQSLRILTGRSTLGASFRLTSLGREVANGMTHQ